MSAAPPFKQGDWITIAYSHSASYAPEGQRVWRAEVTPKRAANTESGWGVGGVCAGHFRKATREDIMAEAKRVADLLREMNLRREALLKAAAEMEKKAS